MPEISDEKLSFTKGDNGVRITHPDREAFLVDIFGRLSGGHGFTVATLNLDHVVKLRQDLAFRQAYLAHSHVVADGNPVVWLSRLAGRRVDLVPGSELIAPLGDMAAAAGVRVALVGSTEESLDRSAVKLEAAHPGLRIVCRIAPPFGFDPNGAQVPELARQIGESGAGLCFLALGAPKQERLAARLAMYLPHCGFVSIGAGLDFISGTQTRAPVWVRRLALEWVWRLASNPRRLAGRYAACIAILPGLARHALRARLRKS